MWVGDELVPMKMYFGMQTHNLSPGCKQHNWGLMQDEMILQDEPFMKPGLGELPNAVVVPHIASASKVTDPLPVFI